MLYEYAQSWPSEVEHNLKWHSVPSFASHILEDSCAIWCIVRT